MGKKRTRTEEELAFAAAYQQRKRGDAPAERVVCYQNIATREVYLTIQAGKESLMQRGYCRIGGDVGAGDAPRYPINDEDWARQLRFGRFVELGELTCTGLT